MKSQTQVITQSLSVTSTDLAALDITQYSGAALQVDCPAASTGTAKLQWSNNGTVWHDVASGSVALSASTSVGVVVSGLYGSLLRVNMNVTAGAGSYTIRLTVKER